MRMSQIKRVAAAGAVHEAWGPALKESGLEFFNLKSMDDAERTSADCILVDASEQKWIQHIPELKKSGASIISFVKDDVERSALVHLKTSGGEGVVSEKTPAEEVVVRIRAMLAEEQKAQSKEARAAKRVWFQQEVEFTAFERTHKAWSTTLSETGIFLRTPLTLPLYTIIQLKFNLLGEKEEFQCSGVIVRQEVEGDIRGIGVMFQNLKGENVRLLESFLELY
jgi:hypothetical protein